MKPVILISTLLFTACASMAPFTITQHGDTYRSVNNRISTKSIAGGTHIDARGVFVNPVVIKNKATGKTELIYLAITNDTHNSSNSVGMNQLGIINKMACIADGAAVNLTTANHKNFNQGVITYNAVSNIADVSKMETAQMPITADQFKTLANAQQLACKIQGSRQTVAYNNHDIAPDFVKNLHTFYTQKIK